MRLSPFAAAVLLVAPLAACGSDTPPPLTGNLTDARGAHAGSFRVPDNGTGDYGKAAKGIEPKTSTRTQGTTQ
ncbi:hypothetical protein [uncultured Sphingomonas sp.]|uniref:hypothetical protein n=1 Tax=uncultured Sphingomonas sp. TaxID=158754 RepID=UPI0035CC182E